MSKKRTIPNPMTGGISPSRQHYSLGFLSTMLQKPPEFIVQLAEVAGVEPDHYVNSVPHYRGDQLQQMMAKLQDARDEATAAQFN